MVKRKKKETEMIAPIKERTGTRMCTMTREDLAEAAERIQSLADEISAIGDSMDEAKISQIEFNGNELLNRGDDALIRFIGQASRGFQKAKLANR